MRLLALGALGAGVVAAIAVERIPDWAYHPFNVAGTTAVTALIWLSHGGNAAAALAVVYVFVPLDSFFFFRWRTATLYQMYGVAAALFTWLVLGDLSAGIVLALIGTFGVAAFVVGWLVREASRAEIDETTGLLNRRGVDLAADAALLRAGRSGEPLSVALLDVDHFRKLNESRGHAAGDQLLRRIAAAWQPVLPARAAFAREGRDRFVLVLPGMPATAAWALLETLRLLVPEGHSCSAGYAEWDPSDAGETASLLFSRADAALYQAKRAGRNRVCPQPASGLTQRDIREALHAGQLRVAYQPVVDLATGSVAGVEALVRWEHPSRGTLLPAAFIPVAEESALIAEIDLFVLRLSLAEAGGSASYHGTIAVNVSGSLLMQPDLVEAVRSALRESGVPARRLILEVTESSLAADSPDVLDRLITLRADGVRIAIDDFGTGYSSLARLEFLPVDELKIDRAFVQTLHRDAPLPPVIATIIALAEAMGMVVVAEGIEHPHQAELLARRGCDYGQGWLFGRPGSLAELPPDSAFSGAVPSQPAGR